MSFSDLPEASCSCGWHGPAADADDHPCTLPDPVDCEIIATVELNPGDPATELGIGVWRGTPDGTPRLFLETDDWAFRPEVARAVADRLREAADLAEGTR